MKDCGDKQFVKTAAECQCKNSVFALSLWQGTQAIQEVLLLPFSPLVPWTTTAMVSMGNITSMRLKKVRVNACVKLYITNPEIVSQL